MLHVTGKVLGVKNEKVTSPTAAFADFVATSIHLLDGMTVDEVRVGNGFDRSQLANLHEGDLLDVTVSLYKGKLYAEGIVQHVPAEKAKQHAS